VIVVVGVTVGVLVTLDSRDGAGGEATKVAGTVDMTAVETEHKVNEGLGSTGGLRLEFTYPKTVTERG
jgi:hypothetical protein